MTDRVARCEVCRVEFEPLTPKIETKDGRMYHEGCWAKINRAFLMKSDFSYGPINEDGTVTFKVSHG